MNPVTKLDKMVPRNLQRKQKGNFLLIAAFLFALYIAFQSKKKYFVFHRLCNFVFRTGEPVSKIVVRTCNGLEVIK